MTEFESFRILSVRFVFKLIRSMRLVMVGTYLFSMTLNIF